MSRRQLLLDTSIWIPYLRARRYARVVDSWIAEGRVWLHSVVLLELFAGTASNEDKRDIDVIRASTRSLGQISHPSEDDFCLGGQLLSHHSRRIGRIRPRDHSHDLLIAIGAARTKCQLVTENVVDMRRWAKLLRQRAGLRLEIVSPD